MPDRGVVRPRRADQVALFRSSPDDAVYALSNYDPFSGAYVLSRGIVGSKGDVAEGRVAGLQADASTCAPAQCLDDPSVAVMTFPVRVVDGRVLEVGVP